MKIYVRSSLRITNKRLWALMSYLFLIFISFALWNSQKQKPIQGFRQACIVGTIIVILSYLTYMLFERKITTYVVLYTVFILFQFGMCFMYALFPEYWSYYIYNNFDDKTVVDGCFYSVICILMFGIGGVLCDDRMREIRLNKSYMTETNIRTVSRFLAFLSGIVAVPYAVLNGYAGLLYGYASNGADALIFSNGLTNAMAMLFVPSMLLHMLYARNQQGRRMVIAVLVLYSLAYLLGGSRSTGLTLLLAIFFYVFCRKGENRQEKRRFRGYIRFAIVACVTAIISIAVAYLRGKESFGMRSPITAIFGTVDEMGFTFTSILFTMKYIPSSTPFQMGASYINAIVALIPSTIDLLGVVGRANAALPEYWMAEITHSIGYNFGLGYSVIAESFYNFGYCGSVFILVQGYIIKRILSIRYVNNPEFSEYINLIIMYALITYPRRQFYTLLKAIEYDIVLIIILLSVVGSLLKNRVKTIHGKDGTLKT